jgi:hypothetical protein
MRSSLLGIALAFAVVGCNSTTAPSPTLAPVPTPSPTVAPTPSASPSPEASLTADPFAGQPYSLTLPAGWRAFDLSDPTAKAALEGFVSANPNFATAIKLFESIPGVRMAVNPLLGNFMLVFTTPSGGIPLDTLSQSFTAQFAAVPGLTNTPKAEKLTLPAGEAVHWDLTLNGNKPGGGTVSVQESVYLLANSSQAVIMEFVTLSGGVIPDENSIVNSFQFKS